MKKETYFLIMETYRSKGAKDRERRTREAVNLCLKGRGAPRSAEER